MVEATTIAENTLASWLARVFFNNTDPFQVIYDKNAILKEFLERKRGRHQGYRILMVESTSSPREFIERWEVVKDFDEQLGWYKHNWIIYVYGEKAEDIEKFESFYYYSRLGRSFKYNTLFDLFIDSRVNLIKKKQEDSLLEQVVEINKEIAKTLLEVPVPCFISGKRTYIEATTWMIAIKKIPIFAEESEESFIWNSYINKKDPFDVQSVILELIYRHNPDNYELMEPKSKDLIQSLFNFISAELNYPSAFSSSLDYFENIKNFMRMLVTFGKPYLASRTKKGSKIRTLGSFMSSAEDKNILTTDTRKILAKIMMEWVNTSNKILLHRFRQWMEILRKDMPKSSITADNYDDFVKKFSFTAIYDTRLIAFLINHINKITSSKDEWKKLISEIIKKRKKIWEKNARSWWNNQKLFVHRNFSASIKELWDLAKYLGLINFINVSKDSHWNEVNEIAWEVERFNNEISKPHLNQIIATNETLKPLRIPLAELKSKYETLNSIFNEIFSNFYLNEFSSSTEYSIANQGRNILNRCIEHIKNGEKIAIIFCDAMRRDLVFKIKQDLEKQLRLDKMKIEQWSIDLIQNFCYLPSKTNIGWASILRFNDNLVYNPLKSKENLVDVELIIESGKNDLKILSTPTERIERLKEILQEAGNPIEIYEIDVMNFLGNINDLRRQMKSDSKYYLPVLWFAKIDDHEMDLSRFYTTIETYLKEIVNIIHRIHEIDIPHVYVFTDHGFIFGSNEKILEKIPEGSLYKRYCISTHEFSGDEQTKYQDWRFFDPKKHDIGLRKEVGGSISVITPKNTYLFKKFVKGDLLLTHGGLSFQECDLQFIHSFCRLKPLVEIESISPIDHEKTSTLEESDVFVLKTMGDSYYLKIQLKTYEEKDKTQKLIPLLIKVVSDDNRISVKPDKEIRLISGQSYNYEVFFHKEHEIKRIKIKILDSENEILDIKEFHVTKPSIYEGIDFFDED